MIAWATHALAASPEVGAAGAYGVTSAGERMRTQLGLTAHVAQPVAPRLHAELRASFAMTPARADDLPWIAGALGPRLFFGSPGEPVLSALVAGGVGRGDAWRPLALAGMAVDGGWAKGPRARAELTYAFDLGGERRALLAVGLLVGRPRPGPDAIVEASDPPDEPTERDEPDVDAVSSPTPLDAEGMVWLPGPVCQWLPPPAAGAEIERLGMQLESLTAVSARTLRATEGAEPAPLPAGGRVFVAAWAGDRVAIDGVDAPVRDGVALALRPEGASEVVVIGGGRRVELSVGVVDRSAVWVGVDPPEPVRVPFRVGSAALDGAARRTLARIAADAGEGSFRVAGSFSPEGDAAANEALANRRAEAVRDALLAAGMPAERVLLAPAEPPAAGLSAAGQRSAVLTPVEVR